MKKAFSTWYNYLIVLGGSAAVALVALAPYLALLNDPGRGYEWDLRTAALVFLVAGSFVALAGFIAQDVYRALVRHKAKNWDDPLPRENVDKAWMIFMPCLGVGIVSLITGALLMAFA